jgi:hypothetical protein
VKPPKTNSKVVRMRLGDISYDEQLALALVGALAQEPALSILTGHERQLMAVRLARFVEAVRARDEGKEGA